MPGARHPGLRARGDDRCRVHLHLRGLEPLRRFRGLDGGHHRLGRGAVAQTGRPGPAAGPEGQSAVHRHRTVGDGHRVVASHDDHRAVPGDVGPPGGRPDREAPGGRHARHRGCRRPQDGVLHRSTPGQLRPLEGGGAVSPHVVRRVRWWGSHQVPHRRPLPDRDIGRAGPRQPVAQLRGGASAAVGAPGSAGRVPGSGAAPNRRPGRRRRLRPCRIGGRSERGRRGPPRWRVAPDPEGQGLPRGRRQRSTDHRRRPADRGLFRQAAATRPRLTRPQSTAAADAAPEHGRG